MGYGIRTSGLITLALGVALYAPTASAQPDPFEDYEEGVSAVDLEEPEEGAEEEAAEEEVEAPAEEKEIPDYSVEQFLWTVGLGTQFSYAGTTNEVLSGDDESNRTLYLRLAPRVGFFPAEQFEVGLALGLLTQLAARESGDSVAQNNFFFEASAHYHIPLGSAFAIVPGLGLGGYFGVGYEPDRNWRLRSGITVSGLFGSEYVESQDETLASNAVNIGFPIELSYIFH
jgi:hypothetical protein